MIEPIDRWIVKVKTSPNQKHSIDYVFSHYETAKTFYNDSLDLYEVILEYDPIEGFD